MTTNKFNWMICAMICAVIFAGCGGSGGTGAGGSGKLTKNNYLGTLPALQARYKADENAAQEKYKKNVANCNDVEKLKKYGAEYTKAKKDLKEQFEADCNAERDRIDGTEIPVSYSKALLESDELFYVASLSKLYFVANQPLLPSVDFSFTAKSDLQIAARESMYSFKEYKAYYRVVSSDGSTNALPDELTLIRQETKPQTITAGTALTIDPQSGIYGKSRSFINGREPERSVNFAGIEFITQSEYEKVKEEESARK